MTLKEQIEQAKGNAATLETLYRQALAAGNESVFKDAIAGCVREYPHDALLAAWGYRLDVQPLPVAAGAYGIEKRADSRQWWVAISVSIVLGVLFIILAGDKPPIPVPRQANKSFWMGWGPLTALAILSYLAAVDDRKERTRWYVISGAAVVIVVLLTVWLAPGEREDVANLTALHLPFIVWAAVGASVVLGYPDAPRQFFGFMVKSVETMVTSGVYLAAGLIFSGLTYGIFAALGIKFSQFFIRSAAAWGLGVIPVLAVASTFSAKASPLENWEGGLARILRILARLLLPLALGVLAIYIFWFIPWHFWRPFRQREILIVYNATLMAVIALLIFVVPGREEKQSSKNDLLLRYGLLSTGVLTLLLNAYALAAIASRIFTAGLTPNRQAVLGWNVVTLLMLAVVAVVLWRAPSEKWADVFRDRVARLMVPILVWALWVLFALPHI